MVKCDWCEVEWGAAHLTRYEGEDLCEMCLVNAQEEYGDCLECFRDINHCECEEEK